MLEEIIENVTKNKDQIIELIKEDSTYYELLVEFNKDLDLLDNKLNDKKKRKINLEKEIEEMTTNISSINIDKKKPVKKEVTVEMFFNEFNDKIKSIYEQFQDQIDFPNSFNMDILLMQEGEQFFQNCNIFLLKLLSKQKEKRINLIAKLVKIGFVIKCLELKKAKDEQWSKKNLSTYMKHKKVTKWKDDNIKRRSIYAYSLFCKFPCFFLLSESTFGSGYSVQTFVLENTVEIIKVIDNAKFNQNSPFYQLVNCPLPISIQNSFSPIINS